MVRTRRNHGLGESSQGPPSNNPLPSPELTLILRSLEAINETLRGRQTKEMEGEHPSSGLGNPEGSRDYDRRPPVEDITRELQKIKLPEFAGGRASERAEAWLEGMGRCFALRDYNSNSKAKIAIFQLRDSALNWWGKLERQLHLTPDTVTWELFEERFRKKYLPAYYEEQKVGAFHALIQGGRTVEEYEIRFMELVKYVSYMDTDQRQVDRFMYGLRPKIRAMVRMWKPSSVAEAVEQARYVEEHLDLKGEGKAIFPRQTGFMWKAPRTFPRGGSRRPPPYGNRVIPRTPTVGISMVSSAASPRVSRARTNQSHRRGTTSGGRGSRGRNSFQRTPHHSVQGPPRITCWGCGGPHYQRDCPKFRTSNNRREGKEPMGGAGSHHRIYAAVDNQQVEHQSPVVETSGMINKVKVKILFDSGATDSFISPVALEKCGLVAYEHDDFKQVEMASRIKLAVGPSVDQCQVNLRVCITKLKAYVIALGTYDVIIGMDWLEAHRALVDCFKKKVICLDDEGRPIEICEIKRGVLL